ncbi:hypothetical protein Pcinc_003622 [Petrolisthes cinctipes]|uniref:Uncharacterized protein n=1 Tax=Petrolisthes cinctipes TaxID=88211 RepID=A0AAE1GIP6_PETCI|nr:hypothetical protein Pcinc_003622 [Petrolisthes cinctipes]
MKYQDKPGSHDSGLILFWMMGVLVWLIDFLETELFREWLVALDMPCMGRRLRRARDFGENHQQQEADDLFLQSSLQEDPEETSKKDSSDGKFFFRLWRTASTTVTITTFSTNRSVTVSVSAMCTYANNFFGQTSTLQILVGFTLLVWVSGLQQHTAVSENAELRFFQSFSTTTWTFLSSFISTVPYTCYISAAVPADNMDCVGRQTRRIRRSQLYPKLEDDEQLYDSLGEEMTQTGDHINENEKFFFTLVRTSSTTVTITTFSTNRSVTVSASAMCQFPNININYC